ncbi:hypothetical protein Nepgr_029583 [Nepenthes gracilis]|uniref:RBR-type E3 ubiquitin transferase n=1 Tax=Nepenthes gracilis TaxID=150966 RepID=A0AAD3TCR9_NEPGR|nr:hypothetical protein Nepgr_029583 [Nepenthes gracilis]
MEDQDSFVEGSCDNSANYVRLEEDEEEFRSCCGDDGEWKEKDESVKGHEERIDRSTTKMYFKAISMEGIVEGSSGVTGIGIVLERPGNFPVICVQKKLDFYVEDSVADYLALMDGLAEATRNNIRRISACTDCKVLCDQMIQEEGFETPLMDALRGRIFELASTLEAFSVNLVSSVEVERPLQLAQVAIGMVSLHFKEDGSLESCSICREDWSSLMIVTLKCSHKFCSHCLRTYVDGKIQTGQLPIRCPQLRCKYLISSSDCKMFLPLVTYDSLERAIAEDNALSSEKTYCPYPNCSVLLDPRECYSAWASSSSQSDNSCVECPACQRFLCVDCGVPWHTSLSCEEYQNLPLEERDASDLTLHRLAQDRRWRRCQQCHRMIELTQGCFHMTCWCGHEFCFSCGAEYRDSQRTCQCAFWDEENSEEDFGLPSSQETEQWPWDSFDSFPMILDAYSDQERSQLALIQRFLAGGISLGDHHPHQSPPDCTDSYADAMKDLHQLPWLERFVSVISDNYYEDYTH